MIITKQQLLDRLPPEHISLIREIEKMCCDVDEVVTKKHRIKQVTYKDDVWER